MYNIELFRRYMKIHPFLDIDGHRQPYCKVCQFNFSTISTKRLYDSIFKHRLTLHHRENIKAMGSTDKTDRQIDRPSSTRSMPIIDLIQKYMKIHSFLALDDNQQPYCNVCNKSFTLNRISLYNSLASHSRSSYHRRNVEALGSTNESRQIFHSNYKRKTMSMTELVQKYMEINPFLAIDQDNRPYCKACLTSFTPNLKCLRLTIVSHSQSLYHQRNIRGMGSTNEVGRFSRHISIRSELSIADLVQRYQKIHPFLAIDEDDQPYCKVCHKSFLATSRRSLYNTIGGHSFSKKHLENLKGRDSTNESRRSLPPRAARSAPLSQHASQVVLSTASTSSETDIVSDPEEEEAGIRSQSDAARSESPQIETTSEELNRAEPTATRSGAAGPESIQIETNSEKQARLESVPTRSGAFSDLNFNELRSPLLATILENLTNGLDELEAPDYGEAKGLFDKVLDSIRVKVGDRDVISLLWHIISHVRTIKTENGDYTLMLKL